MYIHNLHVGLHAYPVASENVYIHVCIYIIHIFIYIFIYVCVCCQLSAADVYMHTTIMYVYIICIYNICIYTYILEYVYYK